MHPDPPRTDSVSWWRRLWTTADPIMVDAGMGGELLVARVRVALTGGMMLIPAMNLIRSPGELENRAGMALASVALLLATAIMVSVRRNMYHRWLGFVTSAMDVTLVSAGLASFLLLNLPHTAVNSKVIFPVYFLAIFATSLRYDARVCITTGLLAVMEYAGIVLWAGWGWHLNDPVYAPYPYGMFSWSAQGARLLILFAAGGLSTLIVVRTQRLRQLSTSDRLTGLFNRGYFEARLAAELSRARRSGSSLSLAMLDVDHFKRFNDQYGHTAGDAALRTIANLIRHPLRRSDIVARYGGEEFVLVFPDTAPDAVLEKLEAIRETIAGTPIKLPRRQPVPGLSISAGIASFPHDSSEAEALIEFADARLFRAKEEGRNRIVGSTASAGIPFEEPRPRRKSPLPFSWRRKSAK